MDALTKLFRRIEQEGFSVPVEMDAEGYLDKQCPSDSCRFGFKILGEDWSRLVSDERLFCPMCGHEAPADHWFTEDQVTQAQEQAKHYVEEAFGAALRQGASDFNRQSGVVKMSVKGGPRQSFEKQALAASGEMVQKITCERCECRFAVEGAAYFCPCCGHRSARRTFEAIMATVESGITSLPRVRTVLRPSIGIDEAERQCRSRVESGLGDCVAAYQTFADQLYESVTGKKARRNAFQRLNDGSRLWKEATGSGYEQRLTADELQAVRRSFQQRHLLEHTGGVVDENYVKQSGDPSYSIGQRIVVTEESVLQLVRILRKLSGTLDSSGVEPTHPDLSESLPQESMSDQSGEPRESWTPDEVEVLAMATYQGRRPRCPICTGPVQGSTHGVLGCCTEFVMLHCERCGADGQFDPADVGGPDDEYTRDEISLLVEQYWARGRIVCPRDGAILRVIRSKTIGRSSYFSCHCPRCGRSFSSEDIE